MVSRARCSTFDARAAVLLAPYPVPTSNTDLAAALRNSNSRRISVDFPDLVRTKSTLQVLVSVIAPMLLKHFDLVSVGVLNKKEPRQ